MKKIKQNMFTLIGFVFILFDLIPFFSQGEVEGGYFVLGIAFILINYGIVNKDKMKKKE